MSFSFPKDAGWEGALLSDRYLVAEQLGAGAMALVYKAFDQRLSRDVAVKILRTDREGGADDAKRLYREAKSAARIMHPGTISIYDVGQVGEVVFVVMELLEGESLDALLKREKRLPFPFVLDAARQAAEALNAIHVAGIVHRDIKPENMFVVPSNSGAQIKLLDFSIAKLSEELETQQLTLEGSVIGSAYYMAPEQVRAKPVSAQTDLYALGCVVYECIVGRPPFDAERLVDLWSKHLLAEPPRISADVAEVPEGVTQLVLSLLAKDPCDRPKSAAAAALQFAALLEGHVPKPIAPPQGNLAFRTTERYAAKKHPPERQIDRGDATTRKVKKK